MMGAGPAGDAKNLFRLERGQLFTEEARRLEIVCVRGSLWLTQPGDGRDIVLNAGERYLSEPAKGKLVAEALEDSVVEVAPAGVIVHTAELEWSGQNRGTFGYRRKAFTRPAGGEKLGCSLYEIEPGRSAFPKHFHAANEEAIYILGGSGTVILGETEYPVREGDYIALPAGARYAHRLTNTSKSVLRYLCFSTMIAPDVLYYPDSKKIGVMAGTAPGGVASARTITGYFPDESRVDYFFREPL